MSFDKRDPFGAQLRKLADNLDRNAFKALSSGVGFADTERQNHEFRIPIAPARFDAATAMQHPRGQPDVPKVEERPMAQLDTQKIFHSGGGLNSFSPMEESEVASGTKESPQKASLVGRMFRFCICHTMDITLVFFTVMISLILLGAAFAPENVELAAALKQWKPIRLVLGASLANFFVGLYITYFLYVGLFKLLVGETFGQCCLGLINVLWSKVKK